MATNYSITKGLSKGLLGAAIAGLSILGFILLSTQPDLYNASVADVVSKYINQLLGGMTVGGAITFVINYIKFNYATE